MRPARLRARGRLLPALAVALAVFVVAAGGALLRGPDGAAEAASPSAALVQAQRGVAQAGVLAALPASGPAAGAPLTAAERQARKALWQARLDAAREALESYQLAARYPHGSRPASEHADQMQPFAPIAEEQPLKVPGGHPLQGVRLRTSQERVFLSGAERSLVTLSLVDQAGATLPIGFRRAVLREVPAPGATARTTEVALNVNDAGQSGDAQAADGIYTAWVQPQAQGFGEMAGLVRLELDLVYDGQPGFLYFDFIYSPETAARWLPGVKEALASGSLEFRLRAEVLIPGRYVVNARVDDASGRSVALLQFNDELPRGAQDIRLTLFGRLVHDESIQFPVTLRDVDAFLLKPDTYPDRTMLPRLAGAVHTSRSYAATDFAADTWSSAERDRYLTELTRDVEQAERELKQLGP